MTKAYSLAERQQMKDGFIFYGGTEVSPGDALILEYLYRIIELLEEQRGKPTITRQSSAPSDDFRTMQTLADI